eukprot:CAMPEP_0194266338 /NCGR_PEP_ID=MMETSP0169-20130528/1277_1 /TAXON_ID=218684 /ORGANISM="Corethron pennatum, Strain L29A3" /LENGTH=614 /DNA_ID=CAMNT_0039006999 /DNA_START=74 /DNA_END=1918 /DNA_ORIENTATION=+
MSSFELVRTKSEMAVVREKSKSMAEEMLIQLQESTLKKAEWKKRLNMPEGRSHSVGPASPAPVPLGAAPDDGHELSVDSDRHEISIDSFAEIESRESFSKYPAHDDARFNSHSIQVRENRHPDKVQIDVAHRERIDGIIKKHRVLGPLGDSFEQLEEGSASSEEPGNATAATTPEEEVGPAEPPGIEFSQSVTDDDITRTYRSLGLIERLNKTRSVPSPSARPRSPTSSGKKRGGSGRKAETLRRMRSNEQLKLALTLGERVESVIEQSVCMITGRAETYTWYEPVKKVYDLSHDEEDGATSDEAEADSGVDTADAEVEDKEYEQKPGDKVLYSKRGTEPASGWQPEDGLLFREEDGSEENLVENVPAIPLVFSLGEVVENIIEGTVHNLTAEKSYAWKPPKSKRTPIPEDDGAPETEDTALDDERRQVSLTQKIVATSLQQQADQEQEQEQKQAEGTAEAPVPEIPLVLSIGEALENVIEGSVRNFSCGSTYEWKDGQRLQRMAPAAEAEAEASGDDWIPPPDEPDDGIPRSGEECKEECAGAEGDPILPSVPAGPGTEGYLEVEEEDGMASLVSVASLASVEDSTDALYAKNDFVYAIGYSIHKVVSGSRRM